VLPPQLKAVKCRRCLHSIFVSGWYPQCCCRSFLCCSSSRRCCTTQARPNVAALAIPRTQWCSSMNQVSLDQVYRLDQTPSARVKRLRKEARGTPPGVRRDELLRRVQQIENISPAQEPLASLDLHHLNEQFSAHTWRDRNGNRCRVFNLCWNNCLRDLGRCRNDCGRLAFGLDACWSRHRYGRISQPF
jgi:hypothetical protein